MNMKFVETFAQIVPIGRFQSAIINWKKKIDDDNNNYNAQRNKSNTLMTICGNGLSQSKITQ